MPKRPVERPRVERPETQLFSLRLEKPFWAELSVLAKLRGKSMNEMLGEVLQEWWATQPEKGQVSRLVRSSASALKSERPEGQ